MMEKDKQKKSLHREDNTQEGDMKQGGGKKIKITNMVEQTSHDITKIAIIRKKHNTRATNEAGQKKGKISPVEKDNEELTVLFKEGIYGNKQEALDNIARWAKRLGIGKEMRLGIGKEMKWIGKPKEEEGRTKTECRAK